MKKRKIKKLTFLYISMLAFVFVASSALALSTNPTYSPFEAVAFFVNKEFPNVPQLKNETTTYPLISAQSALIIDVDSKVVLFEKDADKLLLPASTTKIATALTAMDAYKNSDILTVGREISVDGQKMKLIYGEKIAAQDLLYGLLVYSANDAAEVLAANYVGGRSSFIEAMNRKAEDLSLENTHFANPSGLENSGQNISSARDLVRISDYAMQNPRFAEIVVTKSYQATSIDGKIKHNLVNINELLGKVDGILGIKTGWTENARENLVTEVERDGHKVIIVLLGSQDRFGETEELIDWIFENYEWKEVKPR